MGLANELRKLQELRDEGILSGAEFRQAKRALLKKPPVTCSAPPAASDPFVEALKAWITFKIVTSFIGLIVAAIVFFGYVWPRWIAVWNVGVP